MSTHELHEIRAIADQALAATSDLAGAATAIVPARRAASLDALTALPVK
jgi:hypothetical protein